SLIRSQAIPQRTPSLQENLYSFESRNFNFLTCERFASPSVFGKAMARNLVERCFGDCDFLSFKNSPICLSSGALLKWLAKRDSSQIKSLQSELNRPLDLETSIHYFKLMVKRDAKVKLDSSCLTKHSAAQNIMFHAKAVNALFSPCFDEFKNRFMSCLKKHIVFFTEMDNRLFARVVNGLVGSDDSDLHVGEVDFSKFDKSQDVFIKEFEREIYSLLGFDSELLQLWMEGEYAAKATSLDGKLSFDVKNQRRSGASNTWIGNSVVTLGVLSMYYRVDELSALFVSGDDSLMYSRSPIRNHAEAICIETGFETKFLSPSVPYFCSKFVVHCGHKTYFVPDPFKLMVKLGAVRNELTDKDLFEVFTSFRDLTKDFDDERVLVKLNYLLESKYGKVSAFALPALRSIHCLASNFSSFVKLFDKSCGWVVVPKINSYFKKLISLGAYHEKFVTPFGEQYFISW
ncbi:polymerase, partial [Mint virus 1]